MLKNHEMEYLCMNFDVFSDGFCLEYEWKCLSDSRAKTMCTGTAYTGNTAQWVKVLIHWGNALSVK